MPPIVDHGSIGGVIARVLKRYGVLRFDQLEQQIQQIFDSSAYDDLFRRGGYAAILAQKIAEATAKGFVALARTSLEKLWILIDNFLCNFCPGGVGKDRCIHIAGGKGILATRT